MTRIIREKLTIIDQVLGDFIRRRDKKSFKCPRFNPDLMAAYVRKEMDHSRLRTYERHLFRCPVCARIYKNIESAIETIFLKETEKFGKPLLEKALTLIQEEHEQYENSRGRSRLLIRLKENGMEMTGLFNFNAFQPVLMPAPRQGSANALLKEIRTENGQGPEAYALRLIYEDIRFFSLEFSMPAGIPENRKEKKVELRSSQTRLSRPADQTVFFGKVSRGSHILLLGEKELCRIEAE